MTGLQRIVAAAAVVGLVGTGSPAGAQARPGGPESPAKPEVVGSMARAAAGAVRGLVLDDRGSPLDGAMVSALGPMTAFAVTDSHGRFTLGSLLPGAYLLRVHLTGYSPSRGRIIEVTPATRAIPAISLRRIGSRDGSVATSGVGAPPPVMAAGFVQAADPVGPSSEGAPPANKADAVDPAEPAAHDHSETAWRLRHLKRSVLKDATEASGLFAAGDAPDTGAFIPETVSLLGRAMESSARFASTLFSDFPFSGQLNLLTTGSFDSPQQLFSSDGLSRNVAYLSIGAAAGRHGDWSVQGAMTQGDLASWILSGSYVTRAPARHAYEIGMSYSTQRYDGGNAAALAAVTDGTRNAGFVQGFDQWTISRQVTLGYGARYARYDYLEGSGLFSPRFSLTLTPVDHLRIHARGARRVLAPGAEEFLPQFAAGLWLPPERTFAPLATTRFRPERTAHYEIGVERDLRDAAVVGIRAFYQRVDDQLVTLFGVRMPGQAAAELGHYFVGTAGDLEARGWGVSLTHAVASRLRGSLDYSLATAQWLPSSQTALIALWAPSAVRRPASSAGGRERIHDLTTSVETEIPQTATRVFVLYRINSAFARRDTTSDRASPDARFDVQVNQSLPFLNFTSAHWEMLLAVRNLFREAVADASVYDELLVVRPPKRIVGGLLVRF